MYKYADKGNMTKEEIDLTIKTLIEAKKAGQFRALWKDFNESVNLMASGEVVIQSMWSPAVTAVRTKGIACIFQPLKEGYRAWAAGFGLPATLTGKKLDGAYEFINWFLDGWAGAYLNRQGYYSAVLETAKAKMEPYEWAYWMEGKPAEKDIKAPNGDAAREGRQVRDGGSYEQRMGGIACWNARHGRERPTWSGSGTSSSPPDDVRVSRRALTRPCARGHPAWLHGTALRGGRSLFFFVVPLVLIAAVSFWRLQRLRADPGLHLRQLRVASSTAAPTLRRASASRSRPTCRRSSSACWSGRSRWCSASRSPTSSPSTCARRACRRCCSCCARSRSGPRNVIRMISWVPLLGRNGLVNQALMGAGPRRRSRSSGCCSPTSRWCWPSCTSTRCS